MGLGWAMPRWKVPAPALAPPKAEEQTRLVQPLTVCGCDLGQANDHSTAFVLRRDLNEPQGKVSCIGVRRWPIGYDYCQWVEDILDFDVDVLAPEQNNVGRPVLDMIRRRAAERKWRGKLRPVVTATSRMQAPKEKTDKRGTYLVIPKSELVSSILIIRKRLVLPDVPEIKLLMQELSDFQMRYSEAGTQQFGNVPGKGKHDDIVIAFAIAAFFMLQKMVKRPALYVPEF